MPTKKKRIGFIPSYEILKIISDISDKESLSNSKVVNLLIEEALCGRGLIKNEDKPSIESDFKSFIKEINNLQSIFNEKNLNFLNDKEKFKYNKNNKNIYMLFIQFLHFKKMINIFNRYN